MGQLSVGSITKVIEWGDLATIVGVDTRVSYRTSAGGTGKFEIRMDKFSI
jgi:hypothetical protein